MNTKTDELWVWLAVKGVLRRYGLAKAPEGMPEEAAATLKLYKSAAKD